MQLEIQVEDFADEEELVNLTTQLRRRLLDLDIDRVDLVRQPSVDPGSKQVEALSIGLLLVTLSPIMIREVVKMVIEWLRNRPRRTARITIGAETLHLEFEQLSRSEQAKLVDRVDRFIAKHEVSEQ